MAANHSTNMSPKLELGHSSRQLTPPDSPLPSIRTMLGGGPDQTRKMALDFIAPSNRSDTPDSNNGKPTIPGLDCLSAAAALHRGSRPSTPLDLPVLTSHWIPQESKCLTVETPYNSPEQYAQEPNPRSLPMADLPSPVWSSNSDHSLDSQLYHMDHPFPHSTVMPPPHYTRMLTMSEPRPKNLSYDSYLPTPPRIQVSRMQKRAIQHHAENKLYTSCAPSNTHPARAERFPYDPEERYAIIHLRGLKNLKYEDTLLRFNFLFPPGTPRRCRSAVAKGLPPTYTPRNIQGLQCRWYRIRDEENLPKLRSSGVGGDRSRVEEVLGMMEREGEMGRGFAGLVNTVAEVGNERLPRMARMGSF
jgi:hypothetical protein